jgi:multisubunit Na+/H+ antiporter MnhB subunit
MIELIGIIACIAACIFTPIQTAKVRAGWMPAKYKGTPAEYRAAYLKQLNLLMWVGLGFGVLTAGMAFLPSDPPAEWIVKAVSAALWFTLGALSFFSKRSLATPVPAAQ